MVMERYERLNTGPKVNILMGVHNGAAHLPTQLQSIADQTHQNWHLWCSDDGSTDGSAGVVTDFAASLPGRITLVAGPRRGFSENYMSLIRNLPTNPGFVAFSDQDDEWLPQKLSKALSDLRAHGDHPALYCGRHLIWYPDTGQEIRSASPTRPCSLRNALIENVASGNTVVLNPAAASLAQTAAQRVGPVFAHDWWLYLMICAVDGRICFDNGPPLIRYRQHTTNQIGAGRGIRHQCARKLGVLRGEFSNRITGNLAALQAMHDLLTPQANALIHDFTQARQARGVSRLAALGRVAPYRQNRAHTLGFWGAASLGRV